MRALALGVLLCSLGACRSGPYAPFDTGRVIHCIVVADPAPRSPLVVSPRFTLGGKSVGEDSLRLGARAVEVGVMRVSLGRYSVEAEEPKTGCGARATVQLTGERDRWLVFRLMPGGPGALRVLDRPPEDETGGFEPLVAVPD